MIIPINESRKFYHFKLNNNIPVVIIEDSKIESNTFALKVNAGFYQDNKIFGLAHFLEHMIFMGSKKYSEENHFNKIIALANGYTNAYTASQKTVYYFTGNNKYFNQLIDIFFNLIKDPLINKSSLIREREAVNNEHLKNLLSDMWRLNHLIGLLSDKTHIMNTFGTGNKETLSQADIYEKLHEFHQKYYHPQNMSIVISTKKFNENLKNIIFSTFGKLKNIPVPKINLTKPFTCNNNKIFFLQPKKETNMLKLVFTIPKLSFQKNYLILLEKLLIDDSINSLSKYLIKENLISMLNLSLNEDNQLYQIVELTLLITEKGKTNIYYIISTIYNYLNLLTRLSNKDLSNYLNITLETLKNDFNFEEKPDTTELVQLFIDNITDVPIKNLYNHSYDISEVSLDKFKSDLKKYFIPENTIIIQMYQDHNSYSFKTEPHYNLAYRLVSDKILVDKVKLDELKFNFNKELIPTKLQIFNKKIENIQEKNKIIIFNKSWQTPKIIINLVYDINIISSAKEYLKIILTLNILNYHLDDEMAELTNYGYSFSVSKLPKKNKIIVQLKGWNQNWEKIIPKFLKTLEKNPKKELFTLNEKEYHQYLTKIKYLDPWKMIDYLQDIFFINYPSYQILLKNKISLSKDEYIKTLNNILNSSCFYSQYGNFTSDYSTYFNLTKKFNNNIIDLNKNIKSKIFNHPNTKEKNKTIKILLPLGKYTLKNYSFILLITNIMSEKFFNEIRTKKQLGYLVSLSYELKSDQLFITQKIQNNLDLKKSLKELVYFNKNISVTKKEFDSIKETLILQLTKPNEEFTEQLGLQLNEIINGTMEFNRKNEVVKILKSLSYTIFNKLIIEIFSQKAIVLILK